MIKPTKKAYELVLEDMRTATGKKCKDYNFYCANCISWRIREDLKSYYEMMKNI